MNTHEREQWISQHLGLVHHVARRFHGAAEYDDLVQVGTEGLIHAVDHFDADLGHAFSSYAVPTILGAIRHYLRDHSAGIRVPGRLQESSARVARAIDQITAVHGRSPTIAEIASEMHTSQEHVLEAIEAAHAQMMVSLDSDENLESELGALDSDLERSENRIAVRQALARLPELDQRVLQQRFYLRRSQAQIAEELQISQMQVSRIISRATAAMRSSLVDG